MGKITVTKTHIEGLYVIEPTVFGDSRGYFVETYNQKDMAEAGLTMANVVKTTVFLADMADFAAMNEVYASFFEGVAPARSAVAVKTLPKNALVEIECIAVR